MMLTYICAMLLSSVLAHYGLKCTIQSAGIFKVELVLIS